MLEEDRKEHPTIQRGGRTAYLVKAAIDIMFTAHLLYVVKKRATITPNVTTGQEEVVHTEESATF